MVEVDRVGGGGDSPDSLSKADGELTAPTAQTVRPEGLDAATLTHETGESTAAVRALSHDPQGTESTAEAEPTDTPPRAVEKSTHTTPSSPSVHSVSPRTSARSRWRISGAVALLAGAMVIALVLFWPTITSNLATAPSGSPVPSPVENAQARPTPKTVPTPTPLAIPSIIPKPDEPASLGVRSWDVLGGGECINPYSTPWAQSFTVVSCSSSHAAQMVRTDLLSEDLEDPYPGVEELSKEINALCTESGIIGSEALSQYPDVQVQGTFPATEDEWNLGQRSYYCFVSRASGKPMTSSVVE